MTKLTKSSIEHTTMSKTQRMVFLAILVANSLVLYIIEGMLPVPFIAPGAKLGLANIITVVSLYLFGFFDTFIVLVVRILLATFFASSPSSFFYSIGGGLLSLFAMFFAKKVGKENITEVGVSVIGAVFHNIGQMLVASLIVQNINIMVYIPVLMIAGVGTGIFVGLSSKFILKHWKRLKNLNLH
ncbi:Gx transporter family protein [Thermoanaerobacter wiegelii]|nr:Gx transporter family protein [Thermoanaerobacter wiegelii]